MSDKEQERDEPEVEGHSYDLADKGDEAAVEGHLYDRAAEKGEDQTFDAYDAKSDDDDAVEAHLFDRPE
jgi:hypothetical protein